MRLADLTTLRVGGEAGHVLAPTTRDELIGAVLDVWGSGDEWLLLGGGSNVLVGDEPFDGTVVRVVTRGIERLNTDAGERTVRLLVQAGEPWEELVALTVDNGWAGIEALSGIPGSSGAAPIQNIGAYGQELASCLVAVEFLDYLSGELERIPADELDLGYRTSVLKQGRQGLVVAIEIDLTANADGLSEPIAYDQLANALGVALGDRVSLTEVRNTVRGLRAGKGMLLDDADPDSVSAGSFFTNPIVSESFARGLPANAPRWTMEPERDDIVLPLEPVTVLPDGTGWGEDAAAGAASAVIAASTPSPTSQVRRVKLSAAWLIENSGIRRGFSLPGSHAAVSSKHTLALVNTGGASATEISELARYIQTRVLAEFGVRLHPEPVLVGVQF
ncbi:MAG: UDP-N-acetylenolpyruvoylglucosamine reductase [Glaciihabitans sp.]|nr:UDP-N-acetylenolpyruvoylglucosamine reductase [Glaciihabitans sp.]